METAFQIGIGIQEFQEITPRELNIAVAGYSKRVTAEYEANYNLAVTQAYLTSRFVWQKRVNIKKFLQTGKPKKKKIMTDEEMFEQAVVMNAMFGGKIVRKAPE